MKFPSNRFWTCVRTCVLWDDACVWRRWCMRVMTLMHACVEKCDGVDACVCSYLVGSWPLKDVVAKNLGPVSPMYGACACTCNRTHSTKGMQPQTVTRLQVLAWRCERAVPDREHQPTEGAAEHDAGVTCAAFVACDQSRIPLISLPAPQNMSMSQLTFMHDVSTSQLGVIQNM